MQGDMSPGVELGFRIWGAKLKEKKIEGAKTNKKHKPQFNKDSFWGGTPSLGGPGPPPLHITIKVDLYKISYKSVNNKSMFNY